MCVWGGGGGGGGLSTPNARIQLINYGVCLVSMVMKFHVYLYIKVPTGGNRFFLCPLDIPDIQYCHQHVLCAVVT